LIDGRERLMPLGIGPLELVIVLLIVLVIFGPKRLPGLGRSLGSGMREFKDSITGKSGDGEAEEEEQRRLEARATPTDATAADEVAAKAGLADPPGGAQESPRSGA
jgi:sec-independent protein translocase protein TatA